MSCVSGFGGVADCVYHRTPVLFDAISAIKSANVYTLNQTEDNKNLSNARALQPEGGHARSDGISSPNDWEDDECFVYFNPTSNASFRHWLDSWTEALLMASETLAVTEGGRPAECVGLSQPSSCD